MTQASQNSRFYQLLRESSKFTIEQHTETVRQFKANPHDRDLQSNLTVSRIYVTAHLLLMNKAKEKPFSHLPNPKDLTILAEVMEQVQRIQSQIRNQIYAEKFQKPAIRVLAQV